MLIVIFWIWFQSVNIPLASWQNPLWSALPLYVGDPRYRSISIAPFITRTELMKLATYIAAGWLAAAISIRHSSARTIFVAIFTIGVGYSIYGLTLSALGTSQVALLEGELSQYGRDVSGGFVAKNSFATFTGLTLLVGFSLFSQVAQKYVVGHRGWRTYLRTSLQAVLGRGAPWFVGSLVMLAALIGSDSRAGLISALIGILTAYVLAVVIPARRKRQKWPLIGGLTIAGTIVLFFSLSGYNLQSRFENLIETGGAEELRPTMWSAAMLGIERQPLTGAGLGTYKEVYPIYADRFLPFIVDRAHNDYLEFTLGVGIPAAIIWLLALLSITLKCAIGAVRRRHRQIYASTAAAASILVGVHSIFDFSLQMPAVSLLYSALLGVGIAQSSTSRSDMM